MSEPSPGAHRTGSRISDLCRACKTIRDHTVMALETDGRVARVVCDFCGSQHNYRHGGEPASGAPEPAAAHEAASTAPRLARQPCADQARRAPDGPERTVRPEMPIETGEDTLALLRRVLRQELGLTPDVPAPKWRGGQLVLRPGKPGLKEHVLPIDALFHKVILIRNRLRTLEQQLNAAEIPDDLKLRLQSYISACYGSLTTFNVLFADEADQFKGAGGD